MAFNNRPSAVAQALVARGAPSPFFWGDDGKPLTAAQLKNRRAIEQSLLQQVSGRSASNVGEGLHAVGNALLYNSLVSRNDAAEEAGRSAYAEAFGALGDSPSREELIAASPNGFETPGQSAVWEAMMERSLQGPKWETFEQGGDIMRFDASDPNSTPALWYDGPEDPLKAPTVETRYNPETGLEEKVQWDAAEGDWVPLGGTKMPSNGLTVTTNADGTTTVTQGGPAKLTEGQSKDVGFYTRGIEANSKLATLDSELTSLVQSKTDLIPLGLGNYLRTPEFRQAKVVADQFLAAILRKDTGAAITDQEFELYGPMFLPIPGDDPDTMATKRRMREVAMLAIRSGLGTAEAIADTNRIVLGIDDTTPSITGGGESGAAASLPDPFGMR